MSSKSKNELIKDIMDILDRNYTKESVIYNKVKMVFNRLTKNELSGLYCMIITVSPGGGKHASQKHKSNS